jgi:hypothetical protein
VACIAVAAMVEIVDRVGLSTLTSKTARISLVWSRSLAVHLCAECDRGWSEVVKGALSYGLDLVDLVVDTCPFFQMEVDHRE